MTVVAIAVVTVAAIVDNRERSQWMKTQRALTCQSPFSLTNSLLRSTLLDSILIPFTTLEMVNSWLPPSSLEPAMSRYSAYQIVTLALFVTCTNVVSLYSQSAIDIGNRRELFVDRWLIQSLHEAELRLHAPQSAGIALKFDQPWEGQLCGYVTVLKDSDRFRMYYRGRPLTGFGDLAKEGKEVTCYAESPDGITWMKPPLMLHPINGQPTNIILADVGHATHNFAPFLDTNPMASPRERYKAVGGSQQSGLQAFVSDDGIHFQPLQKEPIITQGAFDSQNNVFWSEHEQCYVCFLRTFKNGVRWITRTTSKDFREWTAPQDMTFGDAPNEHLYTNQTEPYFRAPHLYLGTAARFFPQKRTLSDAEVSELQLDGPNNYPGLKNDLSDGVLLSSRGGQFYQRTFLEALIRPGPDKRNWVARSNYPARGIVPINDHSMSLYVQRHYGQPSHYLERLVARTDGFSSLHAGNISGEMQTKPFIMDGIQLEMNLATSGIGFVAIEIQDESGKPLDGFRLEDCIPISADDIAYVVRWKNQSSLSKLRGKTLRLRFQLRDADIYSFLFKQL